MINNSIHNTDKADKTAHSTDVDPEPALMSPSPVIYKKTGMERTIAAIGTIMVLAFSCGTDKD